MGFGLNQKGFHTRLFITIVFLFLIASCGGGGGGGGGDNPPEPPTRSWGQPIDITLASVTVDTLVSPQIAMSDSRKAIVVWEGLFGSDRYVVASHFDGTSWGLPSLVSSALSGSLPERPQIAMNSAGKGIAVWAEHHAGYYYIGARHFDGIGWTPTVWVGPGTNVEYSPQIAMDAAGNGIAVWQQYVYHGSHGSVCIYGNYYNGSSWGTGQLIGNCSANSYSYHPQVDMDDSGNALVVWEQWQGNPAVFKTIWANHFTGNEWGTTELIEENFFYASRSPKITMNASGEGMAVWPTSTDSRERIRANYFDGTGWGTAEFIDLPGGDAFSPGVVMDAAGNAMAVWEQRDLTNNYQSWANHFDGIAWGTPELISELIHVPFAYDARYPKIAMNASGSAMAVWRASGDGGQGILTSYFNGTSWEPDPYHIFSSGNDDIFYGYPNVAMDADGNAVVVLPFSRAVYASIYD